MLWIIGKFNFEQKSSYYPHWDISNLSTIPFIIPHKLYLAAGPKPHEVAKAKIQFQFLASQYPCNKLTRHWTADNVNGYCTVPSCTLNQVVETCEHILLDYPAYASVRSNMVSLCLNIQNQSSQSIVSSALHSNSDEIVMQLLLDPSVLPDVIAASQIHGECIVSDLFYCGRNWCFSIHRERMKRLGKWNFRWITSRKITTEPGFRTWRP